MICLLKVAREEGHFLYSGTLFHPFNISMRSTPFLVEKKRRFSAVKSFAQTSTAKKEHNWPSPETPGYQSPAFPTNCKSSVTFPLTALEGYNFHIRKLICLNVSQWLLLYFQCQQTTSIFSFENNLHSPQETSYPLAVTPLSVQLRLYTTTNLLSVTLPILDISYKYNPAKAILSLFI